MVPEALAFVDVETTGGGPTDGRIIEVGIWRTENGVLKDSLVSVIDPDSYVSPWILRMTGIDEGEIYKSPTFRGLAEKVVEILAGAIFVAHNAKFDYGFLKREFERTGIKFDSPTLCTAKLLKKLRSDLKRANLDVLIAEYELECVNRHRAGDDAKVLMDFFEVAPKFHGEGFWEVVRGMTRY